MIDLYGEEIKDPICDIKYKPMTLFECVNSLRNNTDIRNKDPELKSFVPFMINRAFMQDEQTIEFANLMNRFAHLPKEAQYLFYLHGMKKHRSKSKWSKKSVDGQYNKLVECGYSERETKEMLYVLSDKQIKILLGRKK